jgi:signal transduction histidine kinase
MIRQLLLNYKIKNILLFLFFLIILATYAVNSYLIYDTKKSDFYKNIDNSLKKSAISINLFLDNSFHDRATNKNSITTKEDSQNIKKLSQFAQNLEIEYIYTMVQRGSDIYFTSSSAISSDYDCNRVTRYFDKYNSATQELKNVLKYNKLTYEESKDKWGVFRSVFIPMETPNGNKYILGADIRIDYIEKELDKYTKKSIRIFIFIALFLFTLFYVYIKFAKREFELIKDTYTLLERKVNKKTKELKKINSNLEKKIDEEVEKNIHQEKMLIQKSRTSAMGEMMETIIHQWKQPLSVISVTNSKLIFYDRLNKLDSENIKDVSNTISEQIKYMTNTMNDFRNFFKPTPKSDFLLNECVDKSIRLVDKVLQIKEIKINFKYEEIIFNGYQNELVQVFLNIINNAKDVIEEKQPKIKEIEIDIYKENSSAIITFTDYAGGIDDDLLDSIFEPYFTTKEDHKGTGIGLDMSRVIINKAQGSIKAINTHKYIDNQKYYGARFIIKLPLS